MTVWSKIMGILERSHHRRLGDGLFWRCRLSAWAEFTMPMMSSKRAGSDDEKWAEEIFEVPNDGGDASWRGRCLRSYTNQLTDAHASYCTVVRRTFLVKASSPLYRSGSAGSWESCIRRPCIHISVYDPCINLILGRACSRQGGERVSEVVEPVQVTLRRAQYWICVVSSGERERLWRDLVYRSQGCGKRSFSRVGKLISYFYISSALSS